MYRFISRARDSKELRCQLTKFVDAPRKRHQRRKDTEPQGLTLYFNNINGYVSKKDSLAEIIKVYQPDIVGLCETKTGKNENVTIDGYDAVTHNFKKGQEGLAVAVRKGTYKSLEVISKDAKNIFSVQVVYPDLTLRVIVCHGPQEEEESEVRLSGTRNS